MSNKQFKYLEQNCALTLREGLQEYTQGYSHLNKNDGKSEESRWFYCHDCTHVLFGTIPFQIRGETINDVWTLCGTDMTLRKYADFFKFLDYDLVINSYIKTYKTKFRVYLKMLSVVPICIIPMLRGWRMKKKWAWFEPEQYLDISLATLREEFGIKVMKF